MRKPRQEEQRKRVRIGALAGKAFCACALVAAMAPVTALAVDGVEAEASGVNATAGLIAQDEASQDEYCYLYAALNWNEYWANEGVYGAGSDVSSTELDSHGETDKGAFDVVTRATKNHGLHRGSFQASATIYDKEGNTYDVSHWSDDGATIYLADGSTVGWNRGTITKSDSTTTTMDYYKVTGFKYVPVRVDADDLADFKARYAVVENGGTLSGGYSEINLKSYTNLVAEVDATTNGLKVATKNEDGTFSFGAAQAGDGSGIKGVDQKTADPDNLGVTVATSGAYGDFVRVDLLENYGDLGSNLTAVTWKYYGDTNPAEDSSATPLQTYGTKFAADNWMHKKLGIQLGLTESARCALPEEATGVGYWQLVVKAMGYKDTVINVNITDDDLHGDYPGDKTRLEALIAEAEKLVESDYTLVSWSYFADELEETKALYNGENVTKGEVVEQLRHLTAAMESLVNKPDPVMIAGVAYEYEDISGSSVTAPEGYTQIGETGVYYKLAEGSTALSGTLYGMDMSSSTAYSTLYNKLIEGGSATAADYDTVTSATGMVKNKHYGQLSELVARTVDSTDASEPEKNFITGAYCTPATIEDVDVAAYVEAKILEAAGKDLTDAQKSLATMRLNGNATVDPATVKDRVAVDTETTSGFVTGCTYFDPTALTNSKVYGDLKLVIRPKAGANTAGGAEFSWDDYYQSLYAGTISDGTTTVGMAPWIDLYCEDHHFAVEMSIGNGTNPYNTSNMAEVNRFASLYDSASGRLKAGDYTVTLYAAGYNNLKYTFKVGAAVPSEDLKSVEIQNAELSDGATATVSAYSADLPKNELKGRGGTNPSAAGDGEVYAQDVAVANGKVELTRMLDAGDYKVVADGYTYTFTVSAESATAAAEKAAAAASETLAAVDSSNEDSVTAARAAYDALSDEAKAKVDASAVAKLEAAEKAVADAKAAAKAAAEKAAAEKAAAAKAAALAAASTVNKATVTAADVKKASDLGASTITLGPKVKKIAKKAFKGTNITTIVAKTKKLKKKSVKGSLKGSKVQLVKVQIGKKKVNKKFVKKYKKIFTKKVAGKKAKVKA